MLKEFRVFFRHHKRQKWRVSESGSKRVTQVPTGTGSEVWLKNQISGSERTRWDYHVGVVPSNLYKHNLNLIIYTVYSIETLF